MHAAIFTSFKLDRNRVSRAVNAMMAQAKRINSLIIKINK